jgi:hypothetical protein
MLGDILVVYRLSNISWFRKQQALFLRLHQMTGSIRPNLWHAKESTDEALWIGTPAVEFLVAGTNVGAMARFSQ